MERFAYLYNCYITLNGEKTALYFDDFLDQIIPLDPKSRLKTTRYGDFTLQGMMPDSSKEKSRNRKIGFAKFRDRKPYEAEKGTDIAELIKKDVLEMTSAMFIPNTRLVVLEYNHHGPRVNSITSYLEKFLPKTEDENWEIELEPVSSPLGYKDVSNSIDIKSIEITLDIAGKSRHFISKSEEAPQSLFFQIVNKTVETHHEIGANTAKLFFSKGRKSESIDKKHLLSLLELLELQSDLFQSVKIKYKSPTTNRTETVDLKKDGIKYIAVSNIEITSNWQYICDRISDTYYEKNRPASGEYKKHTYKTVKKFGIITK